jgi:glycosyltransferase involved in cell wall biosynthesis
MAPGRLTANPETRGLVSVCVPAYNAAPFVRRTLDSLLDQTYPSVEIIVSDNGSTDETRSILETYLRYGVTVTSNPFAPARNESLAHTSRAAISNAFNALSHAHGQYIALFHADDVYDRTIIERQVEVLRRHESCGLVFTGCRFVDQQGQELRTEPSRLPRQAAAIVSFDKKTLLECILQYDMQLMTPSALGQAWVWRRAGGFDENYEQASDYDQWLRMAAVAAIRVIDEPLFSRRISPGQDSAVGYQLYRFAPIPLVRVLENHLRSLGGAGRLSEKTLDEFKWLTITEETRVSLNYFAAGRRIEGSWHLSCDSKGERGLPRSERRYAQRWNTVRRLLFGAHAVGLDVPMAKSIRMLLDWSGRRQ